MFYLKLKGKNFVITHPSATLIKNVKLACIKQITSVYSEPGSNSFYNYLILLKTKTNKII